jgi:hypothetical protein
VSRARDGEDNPSILKEHTRREYESTRAIFVHYPGIDAIIAAVLNDKTFRRVDSMESGVTCDGVSRTRESIYDDAG